MTAEWCVTGPAAAVFRITVGRQGLKSHSRRELPSLSIFGSLVRRKGRRQTITQSPEIHMRFMILVKADKKSEAGILPSQELLAAMGKYNEELAKAGVLLAGEGLKASSSGVRVRFSGRQRTVIDGPFAETKELLAGFWIFQVKSKDAAIEWVKRIPSISDEDFEIEIRQIAEAEDFGAELTPELREQEQRLRSQLA